MTCGPWGEGKGRAGNQGQAPSVSKGEKLCRRGCVTEIPEAAGDGAEVWGVGGYSQSHSIGREIGKNKLKCVTQMQVDICVGRERLWGPAP